MKKFYPLLLTVLILYSYANTHAQCIGPKGPNILGAKGTFSAPFITVNNTAATCASSGTSTFNPAGNVGNALTGCSSSGTAVPCSDYIYTDVAGGLQPEFRYTILKTLGDNTGTNCIRGFNDWKAKDHTGDGGYFMVVNGARNTSFSPVFFQIKSIPVCIGNTYEFSAWVLDVVPGTGTYSGSPNISFRVNGTAIASSGPVPATGNASWVKVGGSFVATTNTVDLQVVNNTFGASGNDLALDDISFNVCQSQIAVVRNGSPGSICSGNTISVTYTVTDNSQSNSWYKWQKSIDGGTTFTDVTTGEQAAFVGSSYALINDLGIVTSLMNGYKYRLVVSTTQAGLSTPECVFFNDYTLIVADCGPLPVQLLSFTGHYNAGKSVLNWQTSQELNNDKFELLRSTDGINFEKITSIRGSGNSSTIKNYSYQDNITGNSASIFYYKLKQIDIDGRATFSPIVKIRLNQKSAFEIFPNPFSSNFTVSFNAPKTSNATLSIRNIAGNLLYTKTISVAKGNNSHIINNLPELGSGVFYISIQNEDIHFNGKLQKMK